MSKPETVQTFALHNRHPSYRAVDLPGLGTIGLEGTAYPVPAGAQPKTFKVLSPEEFKALDAIRPSLSGISLEILPAQQASA